jgi:hypothetical protein
LTRRESDPYTSDLMARSWKEVQSEAEISELTVTLGTHLGMRPQVYVPLIWGALLLAVLFSVLVLPGIRHPGEQVTITSVPEGAQIVVDDQYRGATPSTIFMARGNHDIEITAGTAVERVEAEIGRRLVGSLLVPKRRSYNVVLDKPEIETEILSGVSEFARWSLMGESSAQFQHACGPPKRSATNRPKGRYRWGISVGIWYRTPRVGKRGILSLLPCGHRLLEHSRHQVHSARLYGFLYSLTMILPHSHVWCGI